ncbi:MAG: hypothetical protein OXQ28_07145 [Acidobacteriota bacterium]|nr:hypothetical protein [Acidobacteriota bacterium]
MIDSRDPARLLPQPRSNGKLQTAVRWADDGWWIVTTDGDGRVHANVGPFPDTESIEAQLRRQTKQTGGMPANRGHETTDQTGIIDTLIREGLTRRLANASRAWLRTIDASGATVAWNDGRNIFDPRLAAGACPQIDERHRQMQTANDAYRKWLNA